MSDDMIHVRVNKNTYSETLQSQTRDGIEAICAHYFIYKDRCHLKKDEGSHFIFGYLTLENALNRHYLLEIADSKETILYAGVNDLVNDGWVVD